MKSSTLTKDKNSIEEQKDLSILKSREREASLSKEEFEKLLKKKKLL